MKNWNYLFHAAEKPKDTAHNQISAASISTINEVIIKLIGFYDQYAKNGKVTDDSRKYFDILSSQEKILVPQYLLKLAEVCQMTSDYGARDRALGTIDFIQKEFKIPVPEYYTSVN